MLKDFIELIEAEVQERPSALEFELAYQARVAIDRIRFAIKATESRNHPDQLKEAGMQLMDALDRLEAAERRFQNRWRNPDGSRKRLSESPTASSNGVARANT